LKRLESESPPAINSLPFLQSTNKDPSNLTIFGPTSEHQENAEGMFKVEWKNGMWISTRDDEFRVHTGGNLQFDYGWNRASQAVQFGDGGIGELEDGALFRRARIRLEGTMYSHIAWLAEFDFANTVENDTESSTQQIGSPSFIEVWVTITDLP